MRLLCRLFLFVLACSYVAFAQNSRCDAFRSSVQSTYNFKPSKLTSALRSTKSAAMDKIWADVSANPAQLRPCLEAALEDPSADEWFLFDGSALLVKIGGSAKTDGLLLRAHERVDLDDVAPEVWISGLTRLALKGFDTSNAAARWMTYPKAEYYLPRHSYKVTRTVSALFLYGSMDEQFATPALMKIASDAAHPARAVAVNLLSGQATIESRNAIVSLGATQSLPPKFLRRDRPLTTRAEFVAAFEAILRGNREPFDALVEKVPDGERDVVSVMTPLDIPLIRKVRRYLIASGNPHSIDYYRSFTGILATLVYQ